MDIKAALGTVWKPQSKVKGELATHFSLTWHSRSPPPSCSCLSAPLAISDLVCLRSFQLSCMRWYLNKFCYSSLMDLWNCLRKQGKEKAWVSPYTTHICHSWAHENGSSIDSSYSINIWQAVFHSICLSKGSKISPENKKKKKKKTKQKVL